MTVANRTPMPVDRDIVVSRTFDAPRELVFRAWTEPGQLMRWWAPRNFTTPVVKVDLRPGGSMHYCFRSPEGHEFWGKGIYQEIVVPERIVYLDFFADAEGNPAPPSTYGMSENYPLQTLTTVTFEEVDGKTRVTLRHAVPQGIEGRAETEQGWNEMMDRLAEMLTLA